jgi:hypothetical protein
MDLDQSGTSRQWLKAYLGPSIGWIERPYQNLQPITAHYGGFTLQPVPAQRTWTSISP